MKQDLFTSGEKAVPLFPESLGEGVEGVGKRGYVVAAFV
jgi:hypothetical protein